MGLVPVYLSIDETTVGKPDNCVPLELSPSALSMDLYQPG